jgi:hypothetical protein
MALKFRGDYQEKSTFTSRTSTAYKTNKILKDARYLKKSYRNIVVPK